MATGDQGRRLWHGTTRQRAEAILRGGPDPNFKEPGEVSTCAEGFSTAPPEGPHSQGSPRDCALLKAALFPDEGGPVILEMEVPLEIIARSDNMGVEIRFLPGWGLEELLQVWPTLPKRILPC